VITPPKIVDRVFWISFVSSFLNGVSRLLNIDLNDLAATYNRIPDTDNNEAELVIYDRIPGGAGYLSRIIDNLKDCLQKHWMLLRIVQIPRVLILSHHAIRV